MNEKRTEWLFKLRKTTCVDTLELIAERNRDKLMGIDLEAFNSAADHRMAELITGKLFDKVPSHVWKFIK
ncbi:transcriptional regulator [Dickeya dadantii]|uniref:Hha/YmoA family nucleoid-associated regulatory protein n=1 Tax=Dickeya dadantii TaxID=204038 RepID=UPI0014956537|nr:Hha/YmoA family nucleoid-associated regulatory protein [Dickeya dadantii]NPE55909.1 transcriptional regulator [Dickeya dadantii]NPE67133.1 transcriptional regulator [Dickeya dadantii]